MRISRPLYKYVSHAVTDNRLYLNPQHFSTVFIFLPPNFDGRITSLVLNLNSGKQNVFLQTDQGSYTFYLMSGLNLKISQIKSDDYSCVVIFFLTQSQASCRNPDQNKLIYCTSPTFDMLVGLNSTTGGRLLQ